MPVTHNKMILPLREKKPRHTRVSGTMRALILNAFILLAATSLEAANYYVSPSGLNTNPGTDALPFQTLGKAESVAVAGDTVFIKNGTYQNAGYGNGKTVNNGAALRLTESGNATAGHITFKNYAGHNPKIRCDGAAGISFNGGVSYIIVEGLEIEGAAAGITYAEAYAKRQEIAGNGPATGDSENYYSGRGIVGFGPHNHIIIRNCYVHDTTGSGIRFNDSDHMLIEDCTVARTCWWTRSAESGIVFAETIAASGDNTTATKMIFRRNVVHSNWNRIPFYSSSTVPNSDPPEGFPDYGQATQDYVLDGQGLYVTRSDAAYAGTFLIENNVCVNNGKNGINVDGSPAAKAVIRHNTLYYNGAFDFIQTEHDGPNKIGGIAARGMLSTLMANNIVVCRPAQPEITQITCRADVAGDLRSTYFDLKGAGGLRRFWYRVAGTGTAPANPGAGVHVIAIGTDATAAAVATATAAVIDPLSDFLAPAPSSAVVTVTDSANATRTDAADTGSTGHSFVVTQQGLGSAAYSALTVWDNSPRTVNYNVIRSANYGGTASAGANDITGDPKFINPSTDVAVADFRLQNTSPAIDSALATGSSASTTDFIGTARPMCLGPDRGAYELINLPPAWTTNPFTRPNATAGTAYNVFINFNASDPEADTLTYALVSGPSWLSMTSTSQGRVQGTPAKSNRGLNTFVVSVSDGCHTPVQATMNITVRTDYDIWAASYSGANLTDPNADLNGNGLSNNADRLFGLHPVNPSSSSPIVAQLNSSTGTFSYQRRSAALTTATYTIWTSTNLVNWTQDTGAIQTPGTAVADVETVSVTLSSGLFPATKLFVRVSATD
jgi:Putative Ig domain